MLRTKPRLHLHPVSFLPRPRSDPRREVRDADRHVVARLHPRRAANGLPPPARRGRGRPTGVHNGAARYAPPETLGPIEAREKLHQLEGHPAVLHVLDDARRQGDPERGHQPARQAAWPPGLEGPEAGTEGVRRPPLPGLHPEVPAVGPRGADDAERGAAARVAAATAAPPSQREGGAAVGRAVHAHRRAHAEEQHAHEQQQGPRAAQRGALGNAAFGQATASHVAKPTRLVRIISRYALL